MAGLGLLLPFFGGDEDSGGGGIELILVAGGSSLPGFADGSYGSLTPNIFNLPGQFRNYYIKNLYYSLSSRAITIQLGSGAGSPTQLAALIQANPLVDFGQGTKLRAADLRVIGTSWLSTPLGVSAYVTGTTYTITITPKE